MRNVRVLYHLVRADFLERVRRYSFLLTLAGAAYLSYTVFTGQTTLSLDDHRGVYNSAWVGSMMTLVATVFVAFAGFYVVKNSISRDEQTRVGQVLATTPMTKPFYTLAKALSNFALLAAMILVIAAAAIVLQLARGESMHIQVGILLAPFLVVALPAMALTAAVAVLCETLPIMRGGVGNILYFFVWAAGFAAGEQAGIDDVAGFNLIARNMQDRLKAVDPGYKGGFSLSMGGMQPAHKTFLWEGVSWSTRVVLHHLVWLIVALAAALLASVFFHRFDPARRTWIWKRKSQENLANGEAEILTAEISAANMHLTPLFRTCGKQRLLHLLVAELRLMLKGQRWWWFAGAIGLLVGTLVAPQKETRYGFAVAAWLWPVLIWSKMGVRERWNLTEPLIFSSERSLYRQLPAMWIAGVGVSVITGAGLGVRLLFSGDWPGLAAWFAGALFVPSLALALGVWSGTSKPFEAVYTALWYIGPLHHTPSLDFMGTTARSNEWGVYLFFAGLLILGGYLGRRAQMGYA